MRLLRRDRAAEAEDAPKRKSDLEYWPHGFLEAVLERLATVFAEIEIEQGGEVIYPAWAVWRLTAIEVIKEAGRTKPEILIAAGALLASVLEEEDQLLDRDLRDVLSRHHLQEFVDQIVQALESAN